MKKILLLALVMLGGVGLSNAQITESGKIKVYVQDTQTTKWTKMRFHIWDADNGNTAWRGEDVTANQVEIDGRTWYYKEFDTSTYGSDFYLLVASDDDQQTNGTGVYINGDSFFDLSDGSGINNRTLSKQTRYYLLNTSTGLSKKMSTSDFNTYEITLDNSEGTLSGNYVIAETYNYSGQWPSSDGWSKVIRPHDNNNNLDVAFKTYVNWDSKKKANITSSFYFSENFTYRIETNVYENKWSIYPSHSFNILDASGYATYSNDEMCIVSGATAYIASANNISSVTLTAMDAETVWPAKEGMILKKTGNSNIVTISPVASDATASTIGTNYLVGTGNTAQNITATVKTYVFANDDTKGLGFYLASGNGVLAAHKAYLDLGREEFNARDFLSFSFNDETGINEASAANNIGLIYNLQGVRQNQLQKGLNIMNGKKVLVK